MRLVSRWIECGALVTLWSCQVVLAEPFPRFGSVQPVVVSGRPAGNGVVVSAPVSSPQVDEAGNVAFIGSRGAFPTFESGIWFVTASGALSRVAGLDDPAPGAPQGVMFWGMPPYTHFHLAGDGRLTFDAELYRRQAVGPPSPAGSGVWSWSRGSGLQPVAVPGADVPGMPGVTFGGAFWGSTRPDGAVAFEALLAGPTVSNSNRGAAMLRTADGTLVMLARQGDAVPGLPAGTVFTDTPRPVTFRSGDRVAAVGPVVDNVDSRKAAILVGTPGNMTLVASTTSPTNGGQGQFDWIEPLSVRTGGTDRVTFNGRRDFGEGVFSGARAGDLIGYGGGDITWSSTLESRPVNASGQVVYTTDGSHYGDSGIFTGVGGERLTIAREGDAVPGTDGSTKFAGFGGAQDLAVNDAGFVAFTAAFEPPRPGVAGGGGLFLYHRDGGLAAVALTLDSVEVAPGVTLQFTSFSSLSMTDHFLVFDATLSDGSSGVFRVAVPEPGAGLLCLAAPLLLPRRRSGRARLRSRV